MKLTQTVEKETGSRIFNMAAVNMTKMSLLPVWLPPSSNCDFPFHFSVPDLAPRQYLTSTDAGKLMEFCFYKLSNVSRS